MRDIRNFGAVAGKNDAQTRAVNDAAMIAALPSTWYGDGRDLGDRTLYVPSGDWHFNAVGRTRYDGETADGPPHLPGSCVLVGDGPCSRVALHEEPVRLSHYQSGSQHNTNVTLRDIAVLASDVPSGVGVSCLGGSEMLLDGVHLIGARWELDGAQHVRARNLRVLNAGGTCVRIGATTSYQANAWIDIDCGVLLGETGVDVLGAVALNLRNVYGTGSQKRLMRVQQAAGVILENCGNELSSGAVGCAVVDVVGNTDQVSVRGGVYVGGAEQRPFVRLAPGFVLNGLVLDAAAFTGFRGAIVEDGGGPDGKGGVRGISYRALLLATRQDGTKPPLYQGPATVAALDVAGDVAWRSGAHPYLVADGAIGRSFVAQRTGTGWQGAAAESSREVRSIRTEVGAGASFLVPLSEWEGATVDVRAISCGYDSPGLAAWDVRSSWYRNGAITGEQSASRQGTWQGDDVKAEAVADGVAIVLPPHTKRRLWEVEIAVVRRPWSAV